VWRHFWICGGATRADVLAIRAHMPKVRYSIRRVCVLLTSACASGS